MIKTWAYNGVAYHSEWQVRQDISTGTVCPLAKRQTKARLRFGRSMA